MAGTNAKTLIARLRRGEERAVAAVTWPSGLSRSDPDAQRRVLRSLFRAEVDGFRPLARWACAPRGMRTTRLILRHVPLLVDVRPMPLELFVETHGMTPWDMATLVEHGLIIVNLHEYEADEEREFRDHEAHCDVLSPLLRQQRGCRIMYVRRNHYFDLLGDNVRKLRTEEENRARTLFGSALRVLEHDADLLYRLTGFRAAADAALKLAENWSYLVALASEGDSLDAWLKATSTALDGDAKPDVVAEKLRELNAWKHAHASPQVRAFGGTLLLVPEEVESSLPEVPPNDARYELGVSRHGWGLLQAEQILAASQNLSSYRLQRDLLLERLAATPSCEHLELLRRAHEFLAAAEQRVLSRLHVKLEDLEELHLVRLEDESKTLLIRLGDSLTSMEEIDALPMGGAQIVGERGNVIDIQTRLRRQPSGKAHKNG